MAKKFRSTRPVSKRGAGSYGRIKGIFIGCCCLAPLTLFAWVQLPVYRAHAVVTIHGLVAEELSEAVDEHLAETDTSDWVSSRGFSSGPRETYLDLPEVSRFERVVADEADGRLEQLSTLPVKLPVAGLAGVPFWLDHGPVIPVRFKLQGPVHVKVDVSDHVSGLGSSHAVYLIVQARVHLLGPFLNQSILVQESTPIVYFLVSSH